MTHVVGMMTLIDQGQARDGFGECRLRSLCRQADDSRALPRAAVVLQTTHIDVITGRRERSDRTLPRFATTVYYVMMLNRPPARVLRDHCVIMIALEWTIIIHTLERLLQILEQSSTRYLGVCLKPIANCHKSDYLYGGPSILYAYQSVALLLLLLATSIPYRLIPWLPLKRKVAIQRCLLAVDRRG